MKAAWAARRAARRGGAEQRRDTFAGCHPFSSPPISRRGNVRFGTKSRMRSVNAGAPSCIAYTNTSMTMGAHTFKLEVVQARRAPRACRQPGQRGRRQGGAGTETCRGGEIVERSTPAAPPPIGRRGDVRFGTKSRARSVTTGDPSLIDYQCTIMPTGAHNFKPKVVQTRRAPRG